MTTALLVEDDQDLRTSLAESLGDLGYTVEQYGRGLDALHFLLNGHVDVVLLDLGLPDVDGSTLMSMLRSVSRVPTIVVTARVQEEEMVKLLELGADDYITKPFSVALLNARIRAVLRRSENQSDPVVRLGQLVIDTLKQTVTVHGNGVSLRNTEFRLLSILAGARGGIVSTPQLTEQLWGQSTPDATARLDVHLSHLRSALGETARHPRYLQRIRGIGIRLTAPESESDA